MNGKTQVSTSIEYENEGKQQGYLRVPYSYNEAGWASVLIPITVVKNGTGPTLLALGGTHGDEFEGQVALLKLARDLQPGQVQGRVIVIPALNLPAARAGTRLSPLDGVNLNRAFPGKHDDSVTGLIAHYLTNVLFPRSDIVMDLHSGGRGMDFLPVAHLHRVPDDEQFGKMLAAAKAFGTPYVLIYADVAGSGLLPVEAENMGKILVTTEMGGSGQCSPSAVRITETGVRNTLIHFGLIEGTIDANPAAVQVVSATDRKDYVVAPADGIYESFFEIGEKVTAGAPVGQIHFPHRYDWPPEKVVAETTGMLMSRRFPGVTRQGDCVATIARPVDV